jgi:hypothetical protein
VPPPPPSCLRHGKQNLREDAVTTVQVKEKVGASADKVFKDISDFGGVKRFDVVETCEVQGSGVGAVRTINLKGGMGRVVERLETYDPNARSFSYRITNDDCPLPMKNYLATGKVLEDGPNAATVEWTGQFEPVGSEADARAVVEGIYKGGIAVTRAAVGG